MTAVLNPDICVIGGGVGGLALAEAAAGFGASVVLVEKDRLGGGRASAALRMALIASARQAEAIRHADRFGLPAPVPEIDFAAVMANVQARASRTAPAYSSERLGALGIRVIHAAGRFKNRSTLTAGTVDVRARRFLLATGSTSPMPDIPGLAGIEPLTEAGLFDLTERPEHLVILGGNPQAFGMAQALRRLGSAVTLILDGPCLPAEDPELAAVLSRRLRAEGVRIIEHARATRFERKAEGGFTAVCDVTGSEERLEASHLLVMTTAAPDTDGLDLRKAGIATERTSGAVRVSAMLRTSNSRVYAIGGVAGAQAAPGLAEHQAGLVLRGMLFRLPAKQRAVLVPRVVLADPELAQVGLTEAQARKQTRTIRILRQPYADNDRAQAEGHGEGHIKLVIDRNARILGVGIAGANAGDMIAPWTLALSNGLTLRDMAALVAPAPTTGEIGKRAAMAYFASQATTTKMRRLAGLLRRFG